MHSPDVHHTRFHKPPCQATPALSSPHGPVKARPSASHRIHPHRRLAASACSSSPPSASSTAGALRRSHRIRAHRRGAPPRLRPAATTPRWSAPRLHPPQDARAACRAPLRHSAPTLLGRAMAPQQFPPASGYLPHGASSSRTPAAAYGSVRRPLAQGGTKRPPRSPSEMGAAGPLPLANSANLLLHHVTGTPCEPNFFLAKRSL